MTSNNMQEEHTASTIIILINTYKTKNQKNKKNHQPKNLQLHRLWFPKHCIARLIPPRKIYKNPALGKYTMPYFSNIKIYPFSKNMASQDL